MVLTFVLDKWDLREGHDAYAFMERMVNDSQIRKVVLVCDEVYARKADGRSGGVGTEAPNHHARDLRQAGSRQVCCGCGAKG